MSFQVIRIIESAVMIYEEMQPSRDFSKTEAQSSMPKKSLELERKHLSCQTHLNVSTYLNIECLRESVCEM